MRWQVDLEPDESGAVWMRAVGPWHSLNFRTRAAETAWVKFGVRASHGV